MSSSVRLLPKVPRYLRLIFHNNFTITGVINDISSIVGGDDIKDVVSLRRFSWGERY